MRFDVPQFIEIEDKIIGPFTWKQFIYVLGGFGISAVLFLTTNIIIFALFGLPIAFLTFLLAFYPVNNRPFSFFLGAMAQYYSSSRLYLWKKASKPVYDNKVDDAPVTKEFYTPPTSDKNLHSLSRKLELKAIQKEN